MLFFPVGCVVGLLFLLSLPILFILIFFKLVAFSFDKLGLSPEIGILILSVTLVGSMINIPLTKREVEYVRDTSFFGFFRVPRAKTSGLAINVGGAIVPVCLSVYLLTKVPSFWPVLAATGLMAIIAKLLARPVPGMGIGLPMFIPPIFAAIFAVVLAWQFAAPCAYIAGTMGTLIGADLLNLKKVQELGGVTSIGGAGVFAGIFLVGIVSVLLTALF